MADETSPSAGDKVTFSLGKNTKFEEVEISGQHLRFPVAYKRQFRMSATYAISSDQVRRCLPSMKLEPIEVRPGVAMLSVEAFEYSEVDGLKPYNEFGTFVPVKYQRDNGPSSDPGAYCLHLPVTTEKARWGGVAIYGFPKIVADIEFTHGDDSTNCAVWHDGETIAELTVKKLDTKHVSDKTICYTYKDGEILRTLVEAEGEAGEGRMKGGASLKLDTHRIAKELKGLGMGGEPLEYQFTPSMYSLLHRPAERLPA